MCPTLVSESFLDSDPVAGRKESSQTILRAPVRERRNGDNVVCASPNDFLVEALRASSAGEARAEGAMPYCLDAANRRSIYAAGLDAAETCAASFYYLHARRKATAIYSVPWSLGPLYPPAQPVNPVFVFSSGRCGTTLLSRLLSEAGIPSVSEPDFYTQFTAGALYEKKPQFYATEVRDALAILTTDLAHGCGGTSPVIKLRSESCFTTRFLVSMFPAPHRSIFMYRDFEAWAHSTLRNFGYTPRQVLSKYLSGLKSLAALDELGACHVVHYEALLADPEKVCAGLGGFLGREISREAIERALARDAQKDTPLARGARTGSADFEERLAQTIALWQAPHMAMMRNLLAR